MDANAEHAKAGPANPTEGLDRPTPPGGPQRVDEPDTGQVPQPEVQDVRPTDPAPEDAAEENAATSLDQPSDASGGE
jgi:hypothetical protein